MKLNAEIEGERVALEVRRGGSLVPVGGPRQRALPLLA